MMPHLYDEDPRSTILIIPNPFLIARSHRTFGVYLAGIFFSLGWWIFIDAILLSVMKNISVPFVDWVPGILSTLGMLIINFIGKRQFQGETVNNDWKARTSLLTGFTLMTGGFAGSFCVLVYKYYTIKQLSYNGVACIIQNILIISSAITLWFMQNTLEYL